MKGRSRFFFAGLSGKTSMRTTHQYGAQKRHARVTQSSGENLKPQDPAEAAHLLENRQNTAGAVVNTTLMPHSANKKEAPALFGAGLKGQQFGGWPWSRPLSLCPR